jgi:hypothetical protein
MSMICWVLGLTPAQIGALRASPSLASDLARSIPQRQLEDRLAEMLSRMTLEKRAEAEARHQAQLERMPALKEAQKRNAEARARLEPIGPFQPALDLEKSWHILHYLFTGHIDESRAPGDALMTGEEVGDEVGYGPARLHNEQETEEFARFLSSLDLAQLQAHVHYREMSRAGVYAMPMGGGGSEREFEAELRTEVGTYFPRMRHYVTDIADKRGGLLIWLS